MMMRMLMIAGLVAAAPTVPVIPGHAAAAQAPQATQCVETPAKKARKSMFGSLLGGVADTVLGRVGVPSSIAGVSLPVGSLLSDALMKLLDCKEQQQAAAATNEALRGGVGSEAKWQSQSRANVRGVSKVTAAEQLADGSSCMTVTDVVIVDGEETVVPKKMCRAKGASGYAKV